MLDNGEVISSNIYLIENILSKEPLFLLYVPPDQIDMIYKFLRYEMNFEKAFPTIPKGERYNIRKKLVKPWELHLRIYPNGFIESEVEIQREYLEHLNQRRLFVVYEPFKYYYHVYDKLHIYYKPKKKWIIKVIDNFHIKLNPPETLTPWRPIITGIVALSTAGFLTFALSRLRGKLL